MTKHGTTSALSALLMRGVLSLAGCSNDAAEGRLPQEPVVLPVEAGTTTACQIIRKAATGNGCAGTWQCAAPNARDFLCARNEGGLACACTEGDASVRARTDAGCSNESDISDLADRLCGWEVP